MSVPIPENIGTRTRVYVAGPYSSDPVIGTRNAIDVATLLLANGYAPYIPHLTHFWHLIAPQPYDTWMALDFEWLLQCQIVLRLPGASTGADAEVGVAMRRGIPVYYSVEELLAWTQPHGTCWTCGYPLVEARRHETCR